MPETIVHYRNGATTGRETQKTDKRSIRADLVVAPHAVSADCARCLRPFQYAGAAQACATCGDHYCADCLRKRPALSPDSASSYDVRICSTCASIAIADRGSYEQCKVLQPQIRAIFHASDFPSNAAALDHNSVLFTALDIDTKGFLAQSRLATEDALVSLYERNFCGSCGSWGRFLLSKRHCAMCGDVFCARCLLSKLAAMPPTLSTVHVVPQCFKCNAKQSFGPNPWLQAAGSSPIADPTAL